MSVITDKALDYIQAMNTSSSAPHPVDESRAKEMFKYLKHLGHPVSVNEVLSRGVNDGWDPGFTKKMATWADKVASGGRVTVKHPGYFSEDIKSQFQALLR